jgi:hypothetical protein
VSHFDEITTTPPETEFEPTEYEKLVHRVFDRTDSGKLLLKEMREYLIRYPVIRVGESHDPYEIGIEQGRQNIMRGFIETCDKINSGGK